MTDLSAEDQKLVTLARATRARTGAAEGAAVRDADGRTYAAATVDLPRSRSRARGLRRDGGRLGLAGPRGGRRARPTRDAVADADLGALRDFAGAGVVVHLGDPRGHDRGDARPPGPDVARPRPPR